MFDFLGLPSEIRNIIYGYSLTSPYSFRPRLCTWGKEPRYRQWQGYDTINTELFELNRQIRNEAIAVFYANNTGNLCDLATNMLTRTLWKR